MPLSSNGLCEALITRPASNPIAARDVGDGGSRDHLGGRDCRPLGVDAARELSLDPLARFSRVAPDQKSEWTLAVRRPAGRAHGSNEGRPQPRHRLVIERVVPRLPSYAISAKKMRHECDVTEVVTEPPI